jgi:hypothetical protein
MFEGFAKDKAKRALKSNIPASYATGFAALLLHRRACNATSRTVNKAATG